MDAIRKQANKIRDTVAKQQQAVFKTFTGSQAPAHSETVVLDEAELHRHNQLEKLYASTKAAKHYQREIVKGVEGIVSVSSKEQEYVLKLSEDCKKYGSEGLGVGGTLGRSSLHFSTALQGLERERDSLHRSLSTQVAEPLRAMVTGAPLDDARGLVQRYDRLRQEAEGQVAEVGRRTAKAKDGSGTADNTVKLQTAEQKLQELSTQMAVLGKEAASAMIAVQAQQQRLTLQRLIAMVETERTFHQRAAEILDELQAQMVAERQSSESVPPAGGYDPPPPSYDEVEKVNGTSAKQPPPPSQRANYFLAEVVHAFDAEQEGELTLVPGEYVVVRQVLPTGWSEGEVKGQAGWFPSAYVEQRQRVPASKIIESNSTS
eukprot:jgi/Mesen1/2592/ME000164S01716